MKVPLRRLKPGDDFFMEELGISGKLVAVNDCRAVVKLSGTPRLVKFESAATGEKREFVTDGGHTTSWSPNVLVIKE